MTKYLNSGPFSVAAPNTKQYADNWDMIFRCQSSCTTRGNEHHTWNCELKRDHAGPHRSGDAEWTDEITGFDDA